MTLDNTDKNRLDLLRKELNLAGVSDQHLFPGWARSKKIREHILSELLVALEPFVHEGLIPPYGAIIAPEDTNFSSLLPLSIEARELARKAAEGSRALLAWKDDSFAGLMFLPPTDTPELQLVQLAQPLGAVAIRRERGGAVRLYTPSRNLKHVARRWTVSLPAGDAVERILHAVPNVDLRPLKLNIQPSPSEASLGFTAHLLAQYDGATFLSRLSRFGPLPLRRLSGSFSRRSVGEHQGMIPAHTAGRNRWITIPQPHQHVPFLTPRHYPKDTSGTIEDGIGQGHTPPPLVRPGGRNILVRDIKSRISRHQRGGVAVGTETQVDEVQHRRRAGDLPESQSVAPGRGLQVFLIHRHGVDSFGRQRRTFEQALG